MPHKPKYSLLGFSIKSFMRIYCIVVGQKTQERRFFWFIGFFFILEAKDKHLQTRFVSTSIFLLPHYFRRFFLHGYGVLNSTLNIKRGYIITLQDNPENPPPFHNKADP